MNPGGQSAARAPDRLIASVFLARRRHAGGRAGWSDRNTTLPPRRHSSFRPRGSTRSTVPSGQYAHTPSASSRIPSAGRAKGSPCRRRTVPPRQNIGRPPLSVGLPGSSSSIRDHCVSLNIRRSMGNIQIPACKRNSPTVNRPWTLAVEMTASCAISLFCALPPRHRPVLIPRLAT